MHTGACQDLAQTVDQGLVASVSLRLRSGQALSTLVKTENASAPDVVFE